MLVQKIETENGNFLMMSEIGDEILTGYFTRQMTFLRPSSEDEWNHALKAWKTPVVKENLDINPFPYIRNLGNTLYAFFLKGHPHTGIVGRFAYNYENERQCYETLNWEQAIDNKYGADEKIYWSQGAGENIQKAFEEIKGRDKENEYCADEFGVDNSGNICWIHFTCQKPDCDCMGGWSVGLTEEIAVTFNR